jgi:hypothetical protein
MPSLASLLSVAGEIFVGVLNSIRLNTIYSGYSKKNAKLTHLVPSRLRSDLVSASFIHLRRYPVAALVIGEQAQ